MRVKSPVFNTRLGIFFVGPGQPSPIFDPSEGAKRSFMKQFIFLVIFSILSISIPFQLFTQEKEVTLEEVVATATRDAEEIRKIPANVTVITKEEIGQSNAQNVVDLLRNEADIKVEDYFGNAKSIKCPMNLCLHQDITFNVHLPIDIFLGDENEEIRSRGISIIKKFIGQTLCLHPSVSILHFDLRDKNAQME
jgi:hypothetical protein